MTDTSHYITPDQLRIGLYVHIDLGWMDHPFTFNNFKIKDEGQIAEIRKLKLTRLRYDPARSDCEPTPIAAPVQAAEESKVTDNAPAPTPEEMLQEEKTRRQQQRLAQLQQAIAECEKKFGKATNEARQIEREILQAPARAMQQADLLVGGMVESLLTEGEIVLHAMQPKPGAIEHHTHTLNVAVIALILAKSLDMSAEDAIRLGLGALFHDIGKSQMPDRITRKTEPLTKAELSLIQQHSAMGAKFASEAGMHEQVVRIILQHHECVDGSGYPGKLKGEQIDRLSRIAAIANLYDNLCNPLNVAQAMTPYEALSHMFAHQRSKYDAEVLKLLIKNFGVYPPGSLVRLSSGDHGIVVSVNPSKPLRPYVLLHAPEVPRDKPQIVNLGEEASLSITHCLRQNQLAKDILDYLQPATRINYFFDKEPGGEA